MMWSKRFLTSWEDTARFIKLINDWFDVLNSTNMYGTYEGKIHRINLQKQNAILNEMTDAMIKIKVINHTRNVPFQKGIVVTSISRYKIC